MTKIKLQAGMRKIIAIKLSSKKRSKIKAGIVKIKKSQQDR